MRFDDILKKKYYTISKNIYNINTLLFKPLYNGNECKAYPSQSEI
jgi:hypothetical protein